MCLTEYNQKVFINGIHEEGRAEGLVEGLAKGVAKERAKVIERMLLAGKTSEEIANFFGYDLAEVEKVEKSLLATAE